MGLRTKNRYCPKTFADDGYDIADYLRVHPDYGTLADFKRLLREAHRRGLRVVKAERSNTSLNCQDTFFLKLHRLAAGPAWAAEPGPAAAVRAEPGGRVVAHIGQSRPLVRPRAGPSGQTGGIGAAAGQHRPDRSERRTSRGAGVYRPCVCRDGRSAGPADSH